jgi:hypothetical protein
LAGDNKNEKKKTEHAVNAAHFFTIPFSWTISVAFTISYRFAAQWVGLQSTTST